MNKPEKVKILLEELRERLSEQKKEIQEFEQLLGQKFERETGLWEMSEEELEEEMWNRYLFLDRNTDSLPSGDITSARKKLGWAIIFFKKIWRRLTNPYSRMILERQNRFNQETVSFLLAAFLSLQKIKKRIEAFEGLAKSVREKKPREGAGQDDSDSKAN